MELDAFLADAGIEIAAVTPSRRGRRGWRTGASAGGGTRRG